ncbi:NAD-glutamate dehydrogenase [Vulcaniibacterium tengchongense]|uniref:Glutamate dehydrogenase (NAD) n=1 Tax=Vulcaniibacterium tengchongense TaxID=1273429 RepID=A0A3N4VEY5_9GAMM|nr:NAD-glutamate dehydrogenase domain-containing protein [Vulcaniibacterium tengchongense]RPE81542.1 glutamate dehydrogenase (NAD) [Vulcaniibacterium tengchongense]
MSTQATAPKSRTAASKASSKTAGRKAAASAPVAPRSDAVSLEPILAAMRKRLPKARHAEAEAFAQAFYKRMSSDELPQHDADGWAALAADFLEFARARRPGKALVRLFNPTQKADGWESSHTVVQVVNDDMPFLVDSVTMALAEQGIGVHVLGHPVVRFVRDRAGKLVRVGEGEPESLMHLEIDRLPQEAMPNIRRALESVLEDVRAAVRDWPLMQAKMREVAEDLGRRKLPIDDEGRREAQEFLRWAADNHFTFLGYREYEVVGKNGQEALSAVKDSGLGLLRGKDVGKPRLLTSLAAHYMPHSGAVDALILTKTNARATVHRPGYMDYIGVLTFDAKGKPVREERFLGLYTSSAYNRRPWDIPLVRKRYEYVMAQSGLAPDSHSGKALRHILETLPRDELFQASEEELLRTATGILGLQERVRSKLFVRRDRYGRYFSVLAYVPRDRFNTDVRLRIEAMLKRVLHGEHVDSSVTLGGESPLAQLHLIVRPKSGEAIEVDPAQLEAELARIVRNWQDDLREQLIARHGEQRGLALANGYGKALPAGYIEDVSAAVAADDVEHLAALSPDNDLRLSLYRSHGGEGGLRFKFYRLGDDIPLSDALPMMENMGLRVIAEHPYRIEAEGRVAYIQDFEVESTVGEIDIARLDESFEEAFAQIWRGNAENDGFNRLILCAGLTWRQVAMLRGYCKYLLQVGVPFSQAYVESTLNRYPLLARLLVELFEARFDPSTGRESKAEIKAGMERFRAQLQALARDDAAALAALEPVIAARAAKREAQFEATRGAIKALLDRVSSLDEDRILRSFVGVIDATLRTSYYIRYKDGRRADGGPADYISFKFDSAKVPDLPKPRPYREIFVYGPRVEGVHLRFGPVARGGLRWSDRREDFRTEVLGLVKAQMVKNTVIVPVGSKGGFYCKQLPDPAANRDAWFAEGVECYKRFINGLLDVTDNLVDGKVVPPENVVRHDGDDPYLVVAADKGTATFSDIANGIARAHGFWLDDAFASGGSVGYDHKGMGITARGAWESVKRHFRALGRDCQKQDFTVVGIGDMSGDVFGNGMLLSEHIKLVAAFDHRHVFLDPNPDAAISFKERQRMFKLPRSSWDDYDKSKISKGGGVWPRSAKSIPLSAEAKAALGIDPAVTALSPAELISAILKAPVDLLWNGGIGTYVKASSESHADVGDRANNAVRVNGRDLRCRIVGEGGNLGLTQLGRIEAAQHGVLLNTDFIDNSAGVDTSDHEVNIKILLNGEVQKKRLKLEERNKLLAQMTDEVAQLVLTDNYRQNQALSLMERMSVHRLGSKQHFIRTLESQGLLDRQIEFLPTDAEIAERKARGQGLTRPELAVLLSYSKIVLFQQLLDSDVPEDPYLSKELVRYFPQPLQKKYAKAMEQHRLKREIIATAVTNSMVNRMGATFTLRMTEDTGRTPAEVAEAYTIAREAIDARALWAQIDALDGQVPEAVQIDALQTIWHLLRTMSRWLLSRPGKMPEITAAMERYGDGLKAVRAALPAALSGARREAFDARLREWQDKGLPAALAKELAALPPLEAGCDIVEIAHARKLAPAQVAKAYYALGAALHLPWLYEQIEALPVDGRWQALARGALRDELGAQQRAIVSRIVATPGKQPVEAKVEAWLNRDDSGLRFTLAMFSDLLNQKSLDYPTLSVAVRRLAQLASTEA